MRLVLADFNMSCDDTGKLILKPRPSNWAQDNDLDQDQENLNKMDIVGAILRKAIILNNICIKYIQE